MDPLQRQTFQTMREIPVGEHLDLSETELDALPFGAIHLDANGRVRSYNMAESELARRPKADVVGKLFFEEVAPCTNVHAFKGVLDALTQAGGGSEYLDFRFEFPLGFRRRAHSHHRLWCIRTSDFSDAHCRLTPIPFN